MDNEWIIERPLAESKKCPDCSMPMRTDDILQVTGHEGYICAACGLRMHRRFPTGYSTKPMRAER